MGAGVGTGEILGTGETEGAGVGKSSKQISKLEFDLGKEDCQ